MVGMSDERFEAWLRETAKGYNRPPDIPPREEMWDHITSAERRAPSAEMHRRFAVRRLWTLAAAASLLLGAGIGLGYWARGTSGSSVVTGSSGPQSIAPESSVAQTPSALGARRSALDSSPSAPGPRPSALGTNVDELPLGTPTGYDVLASQTLTAAEALLVSFRTSEDTAFDDLMRRWSRELLSTTRLLIESPAAENAQRRRLLEDLELVLVQMAQLPAADAALERDLVKRTITRRQVLTRIRTSIPAGASSGM
jgi:hypothetical protein